MKINMHRPILLWSLTLFCFGQDIQTNTPQKEQGPVSIATYETIDYKVNETLDINSIQYVDPNESLVCLIDTGVDFRIPFIQKMLRRDPSDPGRVLGLNAYDGTGEFFDTSKHQVTPKPDTTGGFGDLLLSKLFNDQMANGHGTSVASVLHQINPNVGIIPIKVKRYLDPKQSTSSTSFETMGSRKFLSPLNELTISVVSKGIEYCLEKGATVFNLSLDLEPDYDIWIAMKRFVSLRHKLGKANASQEIIDFFNNSTKNYPRLHDNPILAKDEYERVKDSVEKFKKENNDNVDLIKALNELIELFAFYHQEHESLASIRANIEANPKALFVIGAGNHGEELEEGEYPYSSNSILNRNHKLSIADFPNVVLVGALNSSLDAIAGFSFWDEGIDYYAPGSRVPIHPEVADILGVSELNAETITASGTSFSAPFISAWLSKFGPSVEIWKKFESIEKQLNYDSVTKFIKNL